jgi:hypothetical protein
VNYIVAPCICAFFVGHFESFNDLLLQEPAKYHTGIFGKWIYEYFDIETNALHCLVQERVACSQQTYWLHI